MRTIILQVFIRYSLKPTSENGLRAKSVNFTPQMDVPRGAPSSCAGEERNVRISGPTQQLLYSKSHDFRGIFALAHSKIDRKA